MTIGVISLAVPLSTSFAGEFLILAGVFQQGWGWAVVGAVSIVLAAMYMLRAISGVLHQDVGPAVPDSALDLRLGELAVVVPLVLCLLGLSAYPNLISGRAFGGNHAAAQVRRRARRRSAGSHAPEHHRLHHDEREQPLRGVVAVIVKPHVDWFSLSPTLALLTATGTAADGRRLHAPHDPEGGRRIRRVRRFRGRVRLRGRRRREEPGGGRAGTRRDVPRPLGRARAGADRRLRRDRRARLLPRALAGRDRCRVLRPARRRRRRDDVLRPGVEPDDALPGARVVLDRAVRPLGDRHRPDRVARGGAQVPDRRLGGLGDAALRLRARLRRDRLARASTASGRSGTATTRCSSPAWR